MQRSDARTYAITSLLSCTCPACEKHFCICKLRSITKARSSKGIFVQTALKCICWRFQTHQERRYDIDLKRNFDSTFAPGALCRSPCGSAATCNSPAQMGQRRAKIVGHWVTVFLVRARGAAPGGLHRKSIPGGFRDVLGRPAPFEPEHASKRQRWYNKVRRSERSN